MKALITPRDVLVLLEKEFKDLFRDYKTIFTTILLPLITLPILGFLSIAMISQQPVTVIIVDLDNATYTNPLLNITVSSKWLLNNLTHYLESYGYSVRVGENESVISDPYVDVAVIIPRGFSVNATSLNTTARVVVYRKTGFQSALRAESTIYSVVEVFSSSISNAKLKALAKLASVEASVDALKNPVSAYTKLVTVRGEPATPLHELRSFFARILVVALSFVVAPAAFYVIDGIIGERERKTFEFLLVSPVPLTHIIYAKLIAATVLGIIAAFADMAGLVLYMASLMWGLGGAQFVIDYSLLGVHGVAAFFTILVTITLALPFITRTRGIRSASNVASIVTTTGMIFFFTGLFVDYARLPSHVLIPLYLIPYTHSILVVQFYVLGYPLRALLHALALAFASMILLIVSSRTINVEKIITAES